MDPTGTSLAQSTVHGTIHGIRVRLPSCSCQSVASFIYADSTSTPLEIDASLDARAGTISAAAVILLTISTKFPQFQSTFAGWIGLIQRVLIIPFMVWVFLFRAKAAE